MILSKFIARSSSPSFIFPSSSFLFFRHLSFRSSSSSYLSRHLRSCLVNLTQVRKDASFKTIPLGQSHSPRLSISLTISQAPRASTISRLSSSNTPSVLSSRSIPRSSLFARYASTDAPESTEKVKGAVIGIDLGTTNSALAITEGKTPRIIENSEGMWSSTMEFQKNLLNLVLQVRELLHLS